MLSKKSQSKPTQRCREKQSKVNVRQLKVQYHFTFSHNEQVPKILLQGKWLEKAGFSVSDEVTVTILDNVLVIGKI